MPVSKWLVGFYMDEPALPVSWVIHACEGVETFISQFLKPVCRKRWPKRLLSYCNTSDKLEIISMGVPKYNFDTNTEHIISSTYVKRVT